MKRCGPQAARCFARVAEIARFEEHARTHARRNLRARREVALVLAIARERLRMQPVPRKFAHVRERARARAQHLLFRRLTTTAEPTHIRLLVPTYRS